MSIANLVGLIGVAAYLLAYGLLQLGILKVEDGRYALLNGIGALAILYSLIFDFNLPSFITQAAWLVLTIIGYARSRSRRTRPETVPKKALAGSSGRGVAARGHDG
jgi:hypothetical protein